MCLTEYLCIDSFPEDVAQQAHVDRVSTDMTHLGGSIAETTAIGAEEQEETADPTLQVSRQQSNGTSKKARQRARRARVMMRRIVASCERAGDGVFVLSAALYHPTQGCHKEGVQCGPHGGISETC